MKSSEGKGIKHTEDNLVKSYKKTKELDNWEKEFDNKFKDEKFGPSNYTHYFEESRIYKLIKDFISSLLQKQRTELEQQKVKVVWNDVCEQIKQESRTELLEEIKKLPDLTTTEFGEETISKLEVINLLNKKDE